MDDVQNHFLGRVKRHGESDFATVAGYPLRFAFCRHFYVGYGFVVSRSRVDMFELP